MDFFTKFNSLSYKIENRTIQKEKALKDIKKLYASMDVIPKGHKRIVKNDLFQIKKKIMFRL